MNMATIYIDDKPHEVKEGQNLLQACLSLGYDLPYFCWHPVLHSVGACRQCAVKQFKDENDKRGRIVMACMTPVAGGLRISIDDPEAKAFRKSVIEWLMANHPHDCPVCDEGGSCHLQDMTVMCGHNSRRFRFKKRTHRNQYLGPFLNHEMNRCIQCYRCVRFYRDYAGGRDFDVMGAHNHVYFGRHEDGVLENEFSGNLAEICPTGVFTDKTLKKHYTRKWDLQWAPSVCPHCGVGCNISPGERYGTLRCVVNRFNAEINGYAICDRGRFGYEHVNSEKRIRVPFLHKDRDAAPEPAPPSSQSSPPRPSSPSSPSGPPTREAALEYLASALSDPEKAIGIGSPRASLEANFALRALVGPERFFAGMSDADLRLSKSAIAMLREGPARTPSVADVEACDAVVVLGEDLTNSAPRLALAVRQAVRRQPMERAARLKIPLWDDAAVRHCCQTDKGPLLVAAPIPGKLDDAATWVYHAAPADIARLGHAIASAIASTPSITSIASIASIASTPSSLSSLSDLSDPSDPSNPNGLSKEDQTLAQEVSRALLSAKRPVVISGLANGSEEVLRAAANVAWALRAKGRDAQLCFAMPERNTMGVALMGGGDLSAAFDLARAGAVGAVIILENDLFRRADAEEVAAFLNTAEHVIAIDSLENATTARAGLVLPAAALAESSGTVVNSEGRAQRFYRCYAAEGDIQESWRWLRDAMSAAGRSEAAAWNTLDDVIAAMAQALPVFGPVPGAAPPASFRVEGQKIPRQPHRYSGRTAMRAHIAISEPKPTDDPDSALAFSMEGYGGAPPAALPAALVPFFWSPGWNSPSATNKYQDEVGGALRGGSSRARLIEPRQGGAISAISSFFEEMPPPFRKREKEWLLVPLHHVFGSEELSALSPPISERAPKPYLALNARDADALGLKAGDEIQLTWETKSLRLPLSILPELRDGVAGLPVGLPTLEWIALPQWVRLSSGSSL
jgi:NADH-quinone oxidoreductase subunit G